MDFGIAPLHKSRRPIILSDEPKSHPVFGDGLHALCTTASDPTHKRPTVWTRNLFTAGHRIAKPLLSKHEEAASFPSLPTTATGSLFNSLLAAPHY